MKKTIYRISTLFMKSVQYFGLLAVGLMVFLGGLLLFITVVIYDIAFRFDFQFTLLTIGLMIAGIGLIVTAAGLKVWDLWD